ncbi:MAG: primosomal protein N' [Acholeplasmatales bacterium]|nr:primosomal protein N' [Acholeplasmatales bacterium]
MTIEVIINRSSQEINHSFDYNVPKELESLIQIGQRVFVPFGNSKEIGYVTKIKDKSDFDNIKNIIEIIDLKPLIDQDQLDLAYEISKRYFTSFGKAIELMIPQGLRQAIKKVLVVRDYNRLPNELALKAKNDEIIYNDDLKKKENLIKKLIESNVLELKYILENKGSIKTSPYVKFIKEYSGRSEEALKLSKYLYEVKSLIKKKELIELGYKESALSTLRKNMCVEIIDKEEYHSIYINNLVYPRVSLNQEQEHAYQEIKKNLDNYKKFLIYGVCGSGKTEIYLNVIEDVINSGGQALMLVPEISLTPQMATRFKSRFGDKIALIHSKLSVNERYDEYRRISRGEARVVLGARSAIFSPFTNLKLIIMDEEQEESYVQDSTPCYDTHFVAEYLAKQKSFPLVLGSATPKVETFYKTLNKEYQLLQLSHRANDKPFKDSKIVDMRDELKKGNRSVFSLDLRNELINTFKRHEQSILFINRRGYSGQVVCRSCGEVMKCPNCDVSLTYHLTTSELICHYCGYKIKKPQTCPNCNSKYIKEMGSGTEKVEEELKTLLPEARIIRMDQDTVKMKNVHEDIIEKINNHEADILLGTQIVAKGLDFPDVSFVGVVNADIGLNMPTFDAYEKTYDLIEQVSGRAGRKETDGSCIVQTYNPDNNAIRNAATHSYIDFYNEEIKLRRISNNPPFSSLILLLFESKDRHLLDQEALKVKKILSSNKDFIVLGPVNDRIYKLNNNYRVVITVKAKPECSLDLINQVSDMYLSLKNIKLYISRK